MNEIAEISESHQTGVGYTALILSINKWVSDYEKTSPLLVSEGGKLGIDTLKMDVGYFDMEVFGD